MQEKTNDQTNLMQANQLFFSQQKLNVQLINEQLYENKDNYIKRANQLAWTMPEISFWIFSSYEIVFPLLLEWLKSLSIPQHIYIDSAWNIIDGIASIGIGLTQISDRRTHRSLINKIKGFANIGSGTQLLLLTALAASHAIPFAFAAAAITDFVLSLDPLLHSLRRLNSFSYWLEDSLAQLTKLETDIIELTKEQTNFDLWVNEHKNNNPALSSSDTFEEQVQWIVEHKHTRLESMLEEQQTLYKTISIRLQLRGDTVGDSIRTIIEQSQCTDSNKIKFLDFTNVSNEGKELKTLTALESTIEHDLHHECNHCAQETFVFCLAAVGWTLFCIPGMQIPASVIIGFTALLYLRKNMKSLSDYYQIPAAITTVIHAVLSYEKDIKSLPEYVEVGMIDVPESQGLRQ